MNELNLPTVKRATSRHLLQRVDFSLLAVQLNAPTLASDYYVAHMADTLCAARLLQKTYGGNIVLDQVEVPDMYNRNHRCLEGDRDFLDYFYEYMSKAELTPDVKMMTVSNALKDHLQDVYGIEECHTIENYPDVVPILRTINIREKIGAPEDARLILYPNNIYPSFEFDRVVKWMQSLPENYYLFSIGRIPPQLKKQLEQIISKAGLTSRVKLLGFIDYTEYQDYACGADLALVARNDKVLNNRVALPNRVFDAIRSELPLFSYDAPDIADIIREYDIGGTYSHDEDDEPVIERIISLMGRTEELKENVRRAAAKMIWPEQESKLLKVIPPGSTVTFLGLRNLYQNNRTLRMARTLASNGCHVKIFAIGDTEDIPEEYAGQHGAGSVEAVDLKHSFAA